MLNIAICDDNKIQSEKLCTEVKKWAKKRRTECKIFEYESSEQFLFCYPDRSYNLLLLDIEMKGISGMELAKKLRAKDDMLPIIFISGYSEYIGEGYDVEALHYLLKPIDEDKLFSVMDKFAQKKEKYSEVMLTLFDETIHVPTGNIIYAESFGKKTEVHLSDEKIYSCNMSIKAFENIDDFIHTHRSYVVNINFIKGISKTFVALDDDTKIPLSRRNYTAVNERFIEFFTR